MSYRDQHHAPGSVERGNDWLDGALAGWLLFIAIGAGQLVLHGLRDGSGATALAYEVVPLVLALAAIFPLLRFNKLGWMLAVACLTLMAVREGMSLSQGAPGWRAGAAFLTVHVMGLAYLLWIVPEFWPRSPADADSAAPSESPASPGSTASPGSAASPRSAGAQAAGAASRRSADAAPADAAPAGPTPATQALAAIHHRIVAAGSACAVTPVSVRAEAGRFGVTPAALRTEGLALYRTFLQHFLADGSLSPDEERELICLERALDLDDDGVWRLRAEAGLVGGPGSPAPILSVLNEALPEAVAENDARVPGRIAAGADDESPPVSTTAAAPDPSAQAGITFSAPRIHSDAAGTPPDAPEPVAAESAASAPEPIAERVADYAEPITEPAADYAAPRMADRAAYTPAVPETPAVPHVTEIPHVTAVPHVPEIPHVPAAADALADYEEHELGQLLRWAGIRALPAGAPARVALERLRALHRTTTEPLESCPTDEPLEPGERCLATRTVELFRAAAAPAGSGADLPGPLLDPRALVDGTPETELELSGYQRMGGCRFVLTERRLLLVARSGQQSALALSRVRAVRPFRNGLQVQPHHGSPVFLAFTGDVDDLAMRIDRAARDLRA